MSRLIAATSGDVRGLHGNLDTTPPVMSATPPTSASITTTTATANWSAATDNVAVTGYNLYNATPGPGGGPVVPAFIDTTVVGTRTYALTGLVPGQDNVIWITAFDAAGNESINDPSILTITTTGTTDVTAPTVPGQPALDSNTTTAQTFHWAPSTDSESGVDHYVVLRNASIVGANVPGTSYTDTGLTANTAYTYTVKAVDGAGNTSAASASQVMTTDPGTDTTKPSNVTWSTGASNIRVNQVDLAWNAATDNSGSIANYKLYWNAGSGTTAGTLWKTLPGTAVTFTATGLTANTTYAFAVTAVDPAGNESNAKSPTILPKTLASGGSGILFMLQATNQSDPGSGQSSLTKLSDRSAANGWKTSDGRVLVDASGNAVNLGGTRIYYSAGKFPTAFSAAATTGGSGTNTNKRVQVCWKGNSGFQNFVDVMNGGADIAYCRFLNSIPAGWEVAMTFHHEPQNDFGTNNSPAQYLAAQRRLGALLEGRNPTTLGLPAKDGGAAAISLNSGVVVYNEICFTIPPSATTNQWPNMKNALPLASQMDAGAKVCLDAYQNPPPAIAAGVPAGGINALYPTPASVWNFFLNNILHAYGYDAAGHGYTVGEWMAPARNNDNANHDGQANAINSYLTFLENASPPPYAIRMWEDRFSITDGSNAQFNQTAFAGAKQAFVTHALGVNARI